MQLDEGLGSGCSFLVVTRVNVLGDGMDSDVDSSIISDVVGVLFQSLGLYPSVLRIWRLVLVVETFQLGS